MVKGTRMIGRAEWFVRRKYSGWGLTPVTWQGYAYIAVVAGIVFLIQQLPVEAMVKMTLTIGLVALIIIDVLHIMASIKMDERETKIEAIAERNASWTMVTALALSLVFLVQPGRTLCGMDVAPFLVIPMVAGLAVKAVSNFVLRNREL